MMEHLDPRSGREELAAPRAQSQDASHEAMLDREVPLESASMSPALHAWLDGETVNEQELKAEGKAYELWSGVQAEAARRRGTTAPMGMSARIMDAITHG